MNAIPASLGIYSVTDAARLTGVPPRQIRGWMMGYGKSPSSPGPILRKQHALRDGELALGFLDLMEVAFLGRLVQAAARQGHAPRWKAIRTAAETARRVLGAEHPFAVRRMHTDGAGILLEAADATGDPALYDLVADNFAMYTVLADSFVASVDYQDDYPRCWTPDERFRRIVVDPARAFGQPIETMSGAPAQALFDAWRAEDKNAARVAAFFGTDVVGDDQAVHFIVGAGAGARPAA